MTTTSKAKFVITKRPDGKFGWRLYGHNGSDIVATDGNQGCNNQADARSMGRKVVVGGTGA